VPTNITDSSSWTATIQTVANGDAGSETNFALAPQGLANRTKYLYDEVITNGIKKIRTAASTAALKALASVSNNDVVFVSAGQGFLYKRNTSGTGSDSGIWYLDHDTESGGWDLVRNTTSGAGLFGVSRLAGVAAFSTTSSTFATVTGSSIAIAGCKTGDVVEISAVMKANADTDIVYVEARVTDGAAANNDLTTQRIQVGTAATAQPDIITVPLQAYHELAADGTATVVLRAKNNDNATSVTVTPLSIIVKVWR
jgi:hypothetical protein